MRYRVKVGKPFDGDGKAFDSLSRQLIVATVCCLSAVFLVGAAVIGFCGSDFRCLAAVWGVVGPTYGGFAGYFFRGSPQS